MSESEPVQKDLFPKADEFNVASREWKGMPEFVQEDQTPWKSMKIHFANREAMGEFSKLIGQRITFETRYLWFPEVRDKNFHDQRYVNES